MIDYVKMRVNSPSLANSLPKNELFSFTALINGEGQKVGEFAKFHNLTIKLYHSGMVEIDGSIHKFWNSYLTGSGSYNWNDFHRLDLFDTVHALCDLLGIAPAMARLHNVEYGVNVSLPAGQVASDVLRRFLTYKTHKFSEKSIEGRGYFLEAEMNDFYVKAYDKGTQYERPEPMLRFEVKAIRMKAINQPASPPIVESLADLLSPARLDQLGHMLLTTYDRCIIAEPIHLESLTTAERETVLKAQDANTWIGLNRSQRNRLRTKYDAIVTKYGYSLRPMLKQLIADKWQQLLEMDGDVLRRGNVKNTQRFTHLSIGVNCSNSSDDNSNRNNSVDEVSTLITSPLLSPLSPAMSTEIRYCSKCHKPLTGRQQKWCSKLCKNSDLNPKNNPRNRFLQRYERPYQTGLHLFDIKAYERLTDQQRAYLSFKGGRS